MTAVEGAWSVHLPTVVETSVRAVLPAPAAADPWPLPRVLAALERVGARREGRFRSVGSGRGTPILTSQEMRWRGCDLHVEAVSPAGGPAEVAVSAPPWDEIATRLSSEDEWWEMVDAVAAAAGARLAVLADGEAPPLHAPWDAAAWREVMSAHLGVLVPPAAAEALGWAGARYRHLDECGLDVVLR